MVERGEQDDIPIWRGLLGVAAFVVTAFALAAVGFIPIALAVVMTVIGGPLFFASFLAARRRKLGC